MAPSRLLSFTDPNIINDCAEGIGVNSTKHSGRCANTLIAVLHRLQHVMMAADTNIGGGVRSSFLVLLVTIAYCSCC